MKHGGGSLIIWGGFAESGPDLLTKYTNNLLDLLKFKPSQNPDLDLIELLLDDLKQTDYTRNSTIISQLKVWS